MNNIRPPNIHTNWSYLYASPSTNTTCSELPQDNSIIIERLQNLELLVSNLLTRIVDLEKDNNNYNNNNLTTYNWSTATKYNILKRSQSSLEDYFSNLKSNPKDIV